MDARRGSVPLAVDRADRALYQAKGAGRNRVALAADATLATPLSPQGLP